MTTRKQEVLKFNNRFSGLVNRFGGDLNWIQSLSDNDKFQLSPFYFYLSKLYADKEFQDIYDDFKKIVSTAINSNLEPELKQYYKNEEDYKRGYITLYRYIKFVNKKYK